MENSKDDICKKMIQIKTCTEFLICLKINIFMHTRYYFGAKICSSRTIHGRLGINALRQILVKIIFFFVLNIFTEHTIHT